MDWEINLGGIKIKSGFIIVFLTFASAVGGGVWTAGELYNRLVVVEDELTSMAIPDISDLEGADAVFNEKLVALSERILVLETQDINSRVERIETKIQDQNISELQGVLADLKVRVEVLATLPQESKERAAEVANIRQGINKVAEDMRTFSQDMDDVWTALDEFTY